MQTILGSGGAIGVELAKALMQHTEDIRLVSRNPEKVNPTDQLLAADLLNPDEVQKAVKGSEVVYLTVGLPYNFKIWQAKWPVIVQNVIDACKQHKSKLVFFDNIYMYDPDCLSHMTEETPIRPVSKKGAIRAALVEMIFDSVEKGELQALVARSADFYGPSIKNTSVMTETVFNYLVRGKKAIWLADANKKHSYTYTPDAGRATALLGNTDGAYNQVWHLPTAPNPFTGKEWVEAIAKELGVAPKYMVASRFMMRMIGLFDITMKEVVEMMYQNDRDYVFDSSKFENRFGFKPASYEDGIRYIVNLDYKKG